MAAYITLILVEKRAGEATYSIHSVALAMFLMISTSSGDIRAAYTLLVWGSSLAQRLFGAMLVVSVSLLVVASMKVLFMDASNNAELVIGAATVLFIADVVRRMGIDINP